MITKIEFNVDYGLWVLKFCFFQSEDQAKYFEERRLKPKRETIPTGSSIQRKTNPLVSLAHLSVCRVI